MIAFTIANTIATLTLLLLACANNADATFLVSNTLGDHMVLQRDASNPPAIVWGFGTPDRAVYTSFNGHQLTTSVNSEGIWRQALPKTAAGGPYTISFRTDQGESAILRDVLFGDVYICSGQSNMQFTVSNGFNASAEAQIANNYPNIRVFTVGQGTSSTTPLSSLKTIDQQWSIASNISIGGPQWQHFSAVCWFFGRTIYDSEKVPLGLISNNWGGTPIQHWSSPQALEKCGASPDSTLFNAMISPYTVGPMSVRGFTWYQGEANVGQEKYYACAMPALVVDWREVFQAGGAWFGFVQLAPWPSTGGISIAALRTAQLAGLSVPNVGMASAVDLGDVAGGIHPRDKQDVGLRLGWAALNQIYGRSTPAIYQQYSSGTASSTSSSVSATITFRPSTQLQLRAASCPVSKDLPAEDCMGFEIQIDDKSSTWLPATASLGSDGKSVVLTATTSGGGVKAIATRYGQNAWPVISLYDSNGLPVLPWWYAL